MRFWARVEMAIRFGEQINNGIFCSAVCVRVPVCVKPEEERDEG